MEENLFSIEGDIFTKLSCPKTLKAWEPFDTCRGILFSFQHLGEEEIEYGDWFVPWIAGLALLRSIGHVLVKIDGKSSERHKEIIANAWDSWKTEAISRDVFFNFVEKERNNILKTFEFGARIEQAKDGIRLMYGDDDDALELYRTAVYWWRYQLESMEFQLRATQDKG